MSEPNGCEVHISTPKLSTMKIILFQAVKMTSSKTQLPYEYYSLPFCKPEHVDHKSENLGMP